MHCHLAVSGRGHTPASTYTIYTPLSRTRIFSPVIHVMYVYETHVWILDSKTLTRLTSALSEGEYMECTCTCILRSKTDLLLAL